MTFQPLKTGTDWREEVQDLRRELTSRNFDPNCSDADILCHAILDLYSRLSELSARVPV
jgi:hypothetical protein